MLTNPPVLYDFCVGVPISRLLTVGSTPFQHSVLSVLNVKALVGAFNQEEGPSPWLWKPMDRLQLYSWRVVTTLQSNTSSAGTTFARVSCHRDAALHYYPQLLCLLLSTFSGSFTPFLVTFRPGTSNGICPRGSEGEICITILHI